MTSMYVRSMLVGTFTFGLLACAGDSTTPTDMETASIQLDLTQQAPSGNTYRLGPATFDINGPTTLALDASGDEPVLHVPVEPGDYEVTLRSGWALQLLDPEGDPTPIVATLTSPALQFVRVEPFRSTPLNFAFHLGESGIDIGIDIEEGVPPGFDGMISPLGDGRFIITFAAGGGACCFDSVSEAQQAYPGMTLFVSPS